VPLVRVDEGMANQTTDLADSIGVIATLATTLGPTCLLIENFARQQGGG
jgi:hypothetical protein